MKPPADDPVVTSPSSQLPVSAQDQTNAMYAYMKGDEFDMGYLADMIAHHVGALNMISQAKNRTKHQEISQWADGMIQTNSDEVKQMMQWQQVWDYIPTDSSNPHAGHAMEMSGLMTEQMSKMSADLDRVSADEYDKAFIQTMIRHQQVAIDMSNYGPKNAKHQELKDFSQNMLKTHRDNIALLKQWQQNWGY